MKSLTGVQKGILFILALAVLGLLIYMFVPRSEQKNEERIPVTKTLPSDIHPDQIVKIVSEKYALVARPSLNVYLPNIPLDFKAEYRGVLKLNEQGNSWDKWLRIEDTNTKISQSNNPFDLWFEGSSDTTLVPHLLLVDVNGAGSGEGLGKVLVPENSEMSKWKVIDCFDFSLDMGRGTKGKQRNVKSKECQAVKVTLAT